MKLRRIILLGLLILLVVGALWLLGAPSRARQDLEATRRTLRQQGFKVDLSDFALATPPEVSRRAARLAATTRAALTARRYSTPLVSDFPALLTAAAPDAALVIWRLPKLRNFAGRDLWFDLRAGLNEDQGRLDSALDAAISGPIRFEPIGQGLDALLPYLADLKNLERALGLQAILALHERQTNTAWTNLLAATCLVTSYEPEPIEICHLVRLACATIAFEITWNVLQAGIWSDEELADLQHRWEAVDFWRGLPETEAYSRASVATAFQQERAQPLASQVTLTGAIHSPRDTWRELRQYWVRLRYRRYGSLADEKVWLLYARDRELELQRAVKCPNWSEMRALPGVTNAVSPFTSRGPSAVILRMNMRMNMRNMAMRFQSQGRGLLGRAAESETRRRLLIIAIALERYHLRHGSYPAALQGLGLVPELLASIPADFMDGKQLRYRCTDDGHFILYSVGLDCVDNRGTMRQTEYPGFPPDPSSEFGSQQGFDMVWPRPASDAEVERLQRREQRARAKLIADNEQMAADAQWGHTARRQAKVETILRTPPAGAKEPTYRGRPLSEVLRNEMAAGTNNRSLAQILTLHQVITGSEPEKTGSEPEKTGSEPEKITFELPINYDSLTNLGELRLYVDPIEDEESDEGCSAAQLDCTRATNGNCLLLWSTLYESLGKHALQAGLELSDSRSEEEIVGPIATFEITNLVQFSLSSARFERDNGVTLRAKLPEPKGTFVLDLRAPGGELLKTLTESTSDGKITMHWDLKDEHGNVCTNESFETIVHIALPASGRFQSLRGP